ncbi:MAG: dihydrofolate reductase [Ignavibacteriaceae bacterium]|nr:dihydrofolate reductase [Ignavibacteriaceae bacterium]
MKKIVIAAVAKNGVIGRSNGDMPWHSKTEFQHFKSTTLGSPVVMGRISFESLGSPLKNRLNIVLTKNNMELKDRFPDIIVFDKLNKVYSWCEYQKYEKIFLIGGGSLFPVFMKDADEMIISIMDFNAEGDIYFPDIDVNIWKINSRDKRDGFEILYYLRQEKK